MSVVAAGVTLQEALIAYDILKKEKISITVVDAFCLKVWGGGGDIHH